MYTLSGGTFETARGLYSNDPAELRPRPQKAGYCRYLPT